MIDPALRKKPTFDELVGELERGGGKIKFPDRTYVHFYDSPVYQHWLESTKVLDDHETRVHQQVVREHEVKGLAGQNGATAAEIREMLNNIRGPPGQDGRDGHRDRQTFVGKYYFRLLF